MSQIPPVQPGQIGMRPHRGTMILVLGILGLVLCFILGIIAWVMGTGDLREMDAGRMDPSGRGMTQAGRIIGMVATILASLAILMWLLIVVAGIGGAIASAP
jgi:hypothetical protein